MRDDAWQRLLVAETPAATVQAIVERMTADALASLTPQLAEDQDLSPEDRARLIEAARTEILRRVTETIEGAWLRLQGVQ
jgi:hypothetical protein